MDRSISKGSEARILADAERFGPAIDVLLALIPELQALYLFGSRASGRERPESDVDFAFLVPEPLPALTRWEIQEELASRLKSDVDLIDLVGAPTVMQMQVVATGTVLYERDPYVRQSFEMRVLSAYALLNEERAGILKRIHEEGRVYD